MQKWRLKSEARTLWCKKEWKSWKIEEKRSGSLQKPSSRLTTHLNFHQNSSWTKPTWWSNDYSATHRMGRRQQSDCPNFYEQIDEGTKLKGDERSVSVDHWLGWWSRLTSPSWIRTEALGTYKYNFEMKKRSSHSVYSIWRVFHHRTLFQYFWENFET